MAHAASALDAAEAALGGLLGGNLGGDPKGNDAQQQHVREEERTGVNARYVEDVFDQAIQVKVEPYVKFERGECAFFDRSSSTEKGRFRVRDARDFKPESMRRKEDVTPGVMLLVGKRNRPIMEAGGAEEVEDGETEQAITLLFDRSLFTEKQAIQFWQDQRHRFIGGGKFDSGGHE